MRELRESGFYWVRNGEEWYVAEWDATVKNWSNIGDEEICEDVSYEEIDERRIVRDA